MSKKTDLANLIDQVGIAHRQAQLFEKKHQTLRKSLSNILMIRVGKDCWMDGAKFKACMLRDREIKIDPMDFLAEVKSFSLRQKLLRVSIGKAKVTLTLAIFRRISKRRYTEPRLNILEIKSDKKRRK